VIVAAAVCVSLMTLVLRAGPEPLPQDKGAAGTWQRLLKLQTTASAMHTTAHPGDEHGGVLAQLSRGQGARVALLTLNRGEAGDNAIGSELFDAVGLIRTEELLMAGRYYGLDRQYFTSVIDYGFSKRLEEALVKWGRENVLRDVVRIIRMDRPFVLIARFQGNERDGHGNHQTAGLITQQAYTAAGDRQNSRADPGWPPCMAAAQALYRRRARERRLDLAHRRGRVQRMARRFVPDVFTHRPQLSAIAEQRPPERAARAVSLVLQTARGGR